MPTIVLAPDSFKESLTAAEVCDALERGLRRRLSDVVVRRVPMADGGEGTVQSLVDATGGGLRQATVDGPLGDPVAATWGLLGDGVTGVVEMAAASGLGLVPAERRDPRRASTRGTGQLVSAVLDAGVRHLVLGIGGSATNDGGAGLAQALGARLLDADGRDLGADVAGLPGAGAAGGLGAGLVAFTGARLRRGVEIVVEQVRLAELVRGADLVVTGEGRMDAQSAMGKTPQGVAAVARAAGVPVVAVAGGLGDGWECLYDEGFAAIIPVVDRIGGLDDALARAADNLERTGVTIGALLAAGRAVGATA